MIPNLVAAMNSKGGVLKTTLTASWAGIAAASGWRVLVVDLDGQGNLHRNLRFPFDGGAGLYDALTGKGPLVPLPDPHRERLHYVGGGPRVDDAINELRGRLLAGHAVAVSRVLDEALRPLAADFDLIVVDAPPRELFLRSIILAAAHYVLIPVDSDEAAYDGAAETIRCIGKSRDEGNPDLEVLGVLLVKIPTRAMEAETRSEIEAIVGQGLAFKRAIRVAMRPAKELRRLGLLPTEYEAESHAALSTPWYKASPEERSRRRQWSASASGLAEDWQVASEEMLQAYTALLDQWAAQSQAS